MKIYKLNSLSTILLGSVLIGLVTFLPVLLIETVWNQTIGKAYSDVTIDFWQALILWLVVLVLLYIIGIFKFEFLVQRVDSLDKDTIEKKLKELQSKSEANQENKTKENSNVK